MFFCSVGAKPNLFLSVCLMLNCPLLLFMTDEDNSSMNETQKLGTPVSNLATSPKTVVGSPFLTRDDIGSQTIEKNGQAKSVRIGRDGRTYISARELGMLVKSSKNANGIIEVPAKITYSHSKSLCAVPRAPSSPITPTKEVPNSDRYSQGIVSHQGSVFG